MNVIVVDDERLILLGETIVVKKVLPDAAVSSFRTGREALDYAQNHRIDIAFLDINLNGENGLELTKGLKETYPQMNIIFCTGYAEYALDAFGLFASGYLMKPLSEEKVRDVLANLRFPIDEGTGGQKKPVVVRCFGNFEVFYNEQPVKFKYIRTKELFAYLVDRNGATLTSKEIMAVLFGDGVKSSYFQNLRSDLVNTFQTLGLGELLVHERGRLGLRREKIACDYFDYLDGAADLFQGEYMTQYSFGEETVARLQSIHR